MAKMTITKIWLGGLIGMVLWMLIDGTEAGKRVMGGRNRCV